MGEKAKGETWVGICIQTVLPTFDLSPQWELRMLKALPLSPQV